ncbi:MAG: GFA family protein [Pigmentiphaga sp.]
MNPPTSTTERHGHCLCGAVNLFVSIERPAMAACHCTRCRRWGGGPALGIETHQAPRIEGEQHLRVYDSSEWADRAFCGQCGSHLFYRLKDGTLYSLSAGLFDASGDWPFELQIFVDEKPANYHFANSTREMTGAEVFAQFPPS